MFYWVGNLSKELNILLLVVVIDLWILKDNLLKYIYTYNLIKITWLQTYSFLGFHTINLTKHPYPPTTIRYRMHATVLKKSVLSSKVLDCITHLYVYLNLYFPTNIFMFETFYKRIRKINYRNWNWFNYN